MKSNVTGRNLLRSFQRIATNSSTSTNIKFLKRLQNFQYHPRMTIHNRFISNPTQWTQVYESIFHLKETGRTLLGTFSFEANDLDSDSNFFSYTRRAQLETSSRLIMHQKTCKFSRGLFHQLAKFSGLWNAI